MCSQTPFLRGGPPDTHRSRCLRATPQAVSGPPSKPWVPALCGSLPLPHVLPVASVGPVCTHHPAQHEPHVHVYTHACMHAHTGSLLLATCLRSGLASTSARPCSSSLKDHSPSQLFALPPGSPHCQFSPFTHQCPLWVTSFPFLKPLGSPCCCVSQEHGEQGSVRPFTVEASKRVPSRPAAGACPPWPLLLFRAVTCSSLGPSVWGDSLIISCVHSSKGLVHSKCSLTV